MKKRLFRIKIVTLVLVVILNTVFLSIGSVFAANQYGSSGADNEMKKMVYAAKLKDAFIYCAKFDDMGTGPWVNTPYPGGKNARVNTIGETLGRSNIFTYDYKVTTGKEIEELVNKSDENGILWCNEEGTSNLTKLFMETFGIKRKEELICKPNGEYGLYTKAANDNDIKCSANNLDLKIEVIKNSEEKMTEYINQIYNNWLSKVNKNLAGNEPSDNLIDDNAALSYTEAFEAFKHGCLGHDPENKEPDYSETGGTNYYNFKIKFFDDNGNRVELYPHTKFGEEYNKSGENSSKSFDNKKNPRTCLALSEIINEKFDQYAAIRENVRKDKYVKPCSTAEIKKRANEIISSYVKQEEKKKSSTPSYFNKGLVSIPANPLISTDSNLSVTKEEYDKVLAAIKSDDFTVDDGNGGRKCLETKNLKSCNTVEKKAQAKKLLEDYTMRSQGNGAPLTEAESAEFTKIKSALDRDDFTVDDGNGGKKCLETENFNSTLPPDEDEWTAEGENDSSTEEQKQSYCQENGGFLSWMLCPTIADGAATASGLLGAITDLTATHKSIIEQFSDQGSAIYKAWSAFRNLANIGFVIMLLVVIFSQVTSIGISNYNIKKILPKLIITAILVNFSYLILGVLIDLSHIIGNGIGSAIRTIAGESMSAEASAQASNTISTIAGAVVGVGLVGGGIAIATTGPAIILPVVLFIITTVISVFFGFVMLTIRQAAIIMVIVLAPLAMVLYALPNTAAITKKYVSTLKALLMLYPMFVLATSAGALASTIIVGTSTDFLMLIVGGLLNILPYFAIPSMTSKSLAGLGAITAGFDKMRAGALKGVGMAGGAIAASEFYKNLKSDYRADQDVNRAANRLRRYRNIEERGGTLSTAQKRRQSESANILMKDAKMRAGGRSAAGIALSNYEGTGFAGLQAAAQNELMEAEDKNNMMLFANKGYTPDDMIGMLKDASAADYTKMTDTEKNANDSLIRSLTKSLMSTKAGKKAFESQIASSKDMRLSNRAFGQIAHAALQTPGLADKYQVMNNQFSSYLNGGGDTSDTDVRSGLMGSTFSNGISKTLEDMNSDNLQKITKFEVDQMYKSGADTTNLDNAFNTLAAASLKDPNLIADFDGIKQEKVLAAQGKYIDEAQKSTINLRSGGSATVYNPPADFGKYTQTKDASGQIFYVNDRGDIFNASTGKQIRDM